MYNHGMVGIWCHRMHEHSMHAAKKLEHLESSTSRMRASNTNILKMIFLKPPFIVSEIALAACRSGHPHESSMTDYAQAECFIIDT